LGLCQRYCEVIASNYGNIFGFGSIISTTTAAIVYVYKSIKRKREVTFITTGVDFTNNTNLSSYSVLDTTAGGYIPVLSATVLWQSLTAIGLAFGLQSGRTVNVPIPFAVGQNNNGSSFIIDAEL